MLTRGTCGGLFIPCVQVSDEDLARLESRIRSINSLAHLQRAQKANVPVDYVLGVGGFDLEKVEEEVSEPVDVRTRRA